MTNALGKVIKRIHYPHQVMLTCVRWDAAYPLSLRHVEELSHRLVFFWGGLLGWLVLVLTVFL